MWGLSTDGCLGSVTAVCAVAGAPIELTRSKTTNAADCNLRLVTMNKRLYPYGLKLTGNRLPINRIFAIRYFPD